MAAPSNGRDRGVELLVESVVLVDLHYDARASLTTAGGARRGPVDDVLPQYDALRRELWYDGQLIKRFGQTSPNQQRILAAFEEESWPREGIFNPLPPHGEIDPAKRLRDTLAALNRHHQTPDVLHFASDGAGHGIRWGLCPERAGGGAVALKIRRVAR